MVTLPDHFSELLTSIEPDENRIKLAQSIPADVRTFLEGCDAVTTKAPHTRLAGSYARSTAINNIKDVDIVLILTDDYRLGSVETALSDVYSALHGLPKKLGYSGEVTVRRRQRRSVNVTFTEADMSLDIVPAVALNGLSQPLEIPDREWTKWVETHPLGYGEKLSQLNQENGRKVVPLVKMLKYWRDVHMTYRRPKSYWLECLVYKLVASRKVTTDGNAYAVLFRDLLGAIYENFAPCLDENEVPAISDPMLGHNVAHNWERGDFKAFMERIYESYRWANRALEPSLSEDEAVKLWVKVFGEEKFPTSADDINGRELKRALNNGTVYTATTGTVFTQKPSGLSKKVPPQRFYGDAED